MIQRTYEVMVEGEHDFLAAWVRLQEVLETIQDDPLYDRSSSIYVKVLLANTSEDRAKKAIKFIREELPKAEITGMSLTLFAQKNWDKMFLRLSVCFFSKTRISVLAQERTGTLCCLDRGKAMGKKIAAMEDVKAVEILVTGGIHVDVAKFLEGISEGNEPIPFFGAVAGTFEAEDAKNIQFNIFRISKDNATDSIEAGNINQYVIGGDVIRNGVVVVVFSGKELHVRADYVLGWKPLGRELTVTKTVGDNCVARIDNMPAAEIYHRYLNVLPDDKFLFNICEFPLMVERNGTMIARVPPCYDDEKRLYFNTDIHEGEKVHLSYGHPQDILRETWQASEEMHFFAPEGIWLCACGNRTFFLKEYAETEIKDYARFCPDLAVSNGQAEIYVHEGKGGLLNTALVVVGMREGEQAERPESVDICSCPFNQTSQLIPLSTRLATFLDVTAQDLREMAIKAEKANVAKSQFLSNMSHEIRTPINAILGMDEMILRECRDKAILEYAENIRTAGNNLLGLVNDILDFSKIEAGKMDIIPVEYALSSMLNDLVNMSQRRAEKKGLRFIMQVPNDIPSILFGDEIRIKQAITNILTNAVKYTEKGIVLLSIEYEKLDEKSLLLKVKVQDTGIGIRKADIQKLFNAFERIEEERNRAIEGTGLGMNITQSLLKLMGSHLEISSIYGEGSTFSFSIVQKVINWDPMGNFEDAYHQMLKKRTEYKESFTAPTARILVVDDTPMNITVVKGLLKQTQVQIDTAESGYECLNRARKTHYDIIFLDHRMPGIDGIETLERMKDLPGSLNQDTPVISLTANAVSGARSMYIEAGFQDYLTKPIHSAQLESLMMKYLPPEKLLPGGKAGASGTQEGHPEEKAPAGLPSWLTEVDGLDTKQGILYCGGEENYLSALSVFAEAILPGIEEIKKYFADKNWKSYTVKVHALKSTSRIIGAKELSERARLLEAAGNNGDLDDIAQNTPALLDLYRSYAEKLAPLLAQEDDEEKKPPIEEAELQEAFDTLKEVTAAFDYDSLKFVLDSLAEYRLPQEADEKYRAIKQAAQLPDWDSIKKLLE